MTEQHTPTEDQIATVIERTGGDPRKLAIAYLRAQKRARDSEVYAGFMGDITDLSIATLKGSVPEAMRAVERAERRVKTQKEVSE